MYHADTMRLHFKGGTISDSNGTVGECGIECNDVIHLLQPLVGEGGTGRTSKLSGSSRRRRAQRQSSGAGDNGNGNVLQPPLPPNQVEVSSSQDEPRSDRIGDRMEEESVRRAIDESAEDARSPGAILQENMAFEASSRHTTAMYDKAFSVLDIVQTNMALGGMESSAHANAVSQAIGTLQSGYHSYQDVHGYQDEIVEVMKKSLEDDAVLKDDNESSSSINVDEEIMHSLQADQDDTDANALSESDGGERNMCILNVSIQCDTLLSS